MPLKTMLFRAILAIFLLHTHADAGFYYVDPKDTDGETISGLFGEDIYVGLDDFLLLAGMFGRSSEDEGFEERYDLDEDGRVGAADVLAFVANFGRSAVSYTGTETIIDNMDDVSDWRRSGGASNPRSDSTSRRGSSSMRLEKRSTSADWARYSRTFDPGQDYARYETVSYWIHIPDPDVIKKISLWFGERERWDGGFVYEQEEIQEGWSHVSMDLSLTACRTISRTRNGRS